MKPRLQEIRIIKLCRDNSWVDIFAKTEAGKEYSYTIAAVHAILTVGKAMVVSEDKSKRFMIT